MSAGPSLGAWLAALGAQDYEAVLREEGCRTVQDLTALKEAHLKEMGLTILARAKVWQAICDEKHRTTPGPAAAGAPGVGGSTIEQDELAGSSHSKSAVESAGVESAGLLKEARGLLKVIQIEARLELYLLPYANTKGPCLSRISVACS
jgi:hypothetical protein